MKEKSNKKLTKFQKFSIYFLFYAFLGWIFEEIYALIVTHTFVKRGFLFGPICPIYGYGAMILILCLMKYRKKPIKLFFISAIVFSAFEYITDFFLQSLFGIRWWDYTGEFLNLNTRISLAFSLVWGFGSVIFIKYLHPFINKIIGKLIKKIPVNFTIIMTRTFMTIMFIDTLLSTFRYIGLLGNIPF